MKPTKKPHIFKTTKNLSSTPTWLFLFNSLCLIIFLCFGVNCHSHTEQELRMLNMPDSGNLEQSGDSHTYFICLNLFGICSGLLCYSSVVANSDKHLRESLPNTSIIAMEINTRISTLCIGRSLEATCIVLQTPAMQGQRTGEATHADQSLSGPQATDNFTPNLSAWQKKQTS